LLSLARFAQHLVHHLRSDAPTTLAATGAPQCLDRADESDSLAAYAAPARPKRHRERGCGPDRFAISFGQEIIPGSPAGVVGQPRPISLEIPQRPRITPR